MKSRLTILIIILMIPPTIVGLIQIGEKIFPNKAQINVYYDELPLLLPNDIEDSIFELNNRPLLKFDIYKTLEISKKSLEEEDKRKLDTLTKIIKGLTSSDIFSMNRFPKIVTLRVINSGKITAHKVKVILPNSGYVEVYEEGKPLKKETISGTLPLSDLAPDDKVKIIYWPDSLSSSDKIKCTFDDGRAEIIKETVNRSGKNVIIDLPYQLVILYFVFFLLVIILSFLLFYTYLERKFKKQGSSKNNDRK